MAVQKNLFSVACFMVNGQVIEWTHTNEDDAAEQYAKLEEAIETRQRTFGGICCFGVYQSVALRFVQSIRMADMTNAHTRRIDIEDTQEKIANSYKNELYGEPKAGFAR